MLKSSGKKNADKEDLGSDAPRKALVENSKSHPKTPNLFSVVQARDCLEKALGQEIPSFIQRT